MRRGWIQMDALFGMFADGRAYLDFPGEAQGAVDTDVLGPAGLLDTLELHLGLGGTHRAQAVRIAAYAAKLRAACEASPNRFFAASFAQDPWATARLVLTWRDQLIEGGWSGVPIGASRIDDIASAEANGPSLPAGRSDRLRAVLSALDEAPPLGLRTLTILGGRALLPPFWQRLSAGSRVG
jgi:hypothetical protein